VDQKNFEKINQRIKQLRKVLNMTQAGFSQVISLSSGYLAGIETEKRKVNDRIIKLICSSFNANENWLRSGDGEIFAQNEDKQFIKLIGLFRELEPRYQDYIFKEISLLLKMQVDGGDDEESGSPE
jgi:transcriptional regulator with XRE-family HTH domain